ncbi:MAG: 8-oxo-dGTP diphosphatase [Sphaerochaetaceae bacterium]|nr:8-oxo-dGTP diphosphatase [Sphaerochaetaceae bacterium]
MILQKITDNYLWFLMVILVVNFTQRKYYPRSAQKRIATLIIAGLAMVYQILLTIILARGLPQYLAIVAIIPTLAIAYPFRRRILLFKRTCTSCGVKLSITETLNYDDNLCNDCYRDSHPEQAEQEVHQEEDAPTQLPASEITDVDQIDWDEWEPTEVATLLYLFDGDKVLLIDKKTGLGKGMVNAPGGHVEEGETAREAAMREITEETGLSVPSVDYKGKLEFQFVDGLRMRGYIFFAYEHSGELIETEEADPFWVPVTELPYDRMWADDELWIPLALKGIQFHGRFVFDGERMLSHSILTDDDTDEAV